MEFFTTSKSERPNHIFKAASQSELFLLLLICCSVSGPKALKERCVRSTIYKSRETLRNILEIWLKIYGVSVKKLLSEKYLEIKIRTLASVQILRQTNKFSLICSFEKEPNREFGRSHLEIVKNLTFHFIFNILGVVR